MTRQEITRWLFAMKRILADNGHTTMAGVAEDAEMRVERFTVERCHEYARLILPSGKMGHIMLVLRKPYDARALAMIYGLLMSADG
jgi:hypothetical protein